MFKGQGHQHVFWKFIKIWFCTFWYINQHMLGKNFLLWKKIIKIPITKKIIGKKIIGITCHNSVKLAKAAIKDKASYIAFGAFFFTKTKKVKFKAKIEILNKAKKLSQTPIVAIGGININNYKKLLLNNANLLAISGYVWHNKKYKPLETIENLDEN